MVVERVMVQVLLRLLVQRLVLLVQLDEVAHAVKQRQAVLYFELLAEPQALQRLVLLVQVVVQHLHLIEHHLPGLAGHCVLLSRRQTAQLTNLILLVLQVVQ